jgi:hypothetical protein
MLTQKNSGHVPYHRAQNGLVPLSDSSFYFDIRQGFKEVYEAECERFGWIQFFRLETNVAM